MNVWQNFYQNIQDPSWPDCANEHEFCNLPAHIQHEILTVFDGERYLKINPDNIVTLPCDRRHNHPSTEVLSDFSLTFPVAKDFFVYYNKCIEGGGIYRGQDYPRVIKYLYPDRKFEHGLDWCAGPGTIGFRLLADEICAKIHLLDNYEYSIQACQKTMAHMPKQFRNRVGITQTSTIASLNPDLIFDLIVSRPPGNNSIIWLQDHQRWNHNSAELYQQISVDKNWAIRKEFYSNIKKHLAADGVILLQEQMGFSSVFEFEDFIADSGLKIKQAFTEKDNDVWYLELTHN